jgi:broad specificity phosphatase PhoE
MARETILTLVRHGETPANLDGVWHGSIDTPLTDRGQAQARAVAGYLAAAHADAVHLYASHLQRAWRTAGAIGEQLGLEVTIERDLGEYHLGRWEGKTYASLFSEYRLFENMREDPDFAPHGGESPRQVAERFGGALRRIASTHPGERVIVVAHGGALAIALGDLVAGDYREWRQVMDNCAVSELVLEPRPDLRTFNHTDHLEGL